MNISFIGFGNMAKAIARGLLHDPKNQLKAAAPTLSAGVNELGITTTPHNADLLAGADAIILAVKPAQMENVVDEIKNDLPHNALLISVAAGIKLQWFEKQGLLAPIVRAMPNIAASAGKGATPLIANSKVSSAQKKIAETIFSASGLMTWVESESDIDAFTALSGSGPAYVFLFAESLIQGAIELGIDEATAKNFALQTIEGAIALARKENQALSELRRQVTSPGGTTAAALEVFEQQDALKHLVSSAMQAAMGRAKELGNS